MANSGAGLLGLSRAGTLRTQQENHRTRVASICLVAGTLPGPLAAGAQEASTWEAAGMRRRASTAAGRISEGGTRTAEEVTPAVTAAASITAEAAEPRPPGDEAPLKPRHAPSREAAKECSTKPPWSEAEGAQVDGGCHADSSWLRLSTARNEPFDVVQAQNDFLALGARRAIEQDGPAEDP